MRLDVAVRTDKPDLHRWVRFLDLPEQLQIAVESHRGREQNQEFVVLANLNGLLPIDFVGRSIQEAAARDQARGIGQPYRIPIGFDLACGWPTRTRAAVKVFKTRRIQEQCL